MSDDIRSTIESSEPGWLDPKPILVAVDMAAGFDRQLITRLRKHEGGTAFEVIEMQRHADRLLKLVSDKLDQQLVQPIIDAYGSSVLTGQGWLKMHLEKEFKVRQVQPWRYHRWPQLPQWRPLMRRPQQRSAKMRKHRRIVLSRMRPNEARRKRAEWERFKTNVKTRDIINPNASKFWKDFF